VSTPAGVATSQFKVLPTISALSVRTGFVGTAVTLTGTTFTGVSSVKFNGVAAPFTYINATTVRTTVPAAATTGPVTLTTPGGTANSPNPFTVLPKITGFTPASGAVGTTVTINGSGFRAPVVKFGDVTAGEIVSATARVIKVKVPNGATTGKITVVTPDGTAVSAANFTMTSLTRRVQQLAGVARLASG
jgi:IPT/TIG domain